MPNTTLQAWLDLQCALVAGASLGLITSEAGEAAPSPPLARWPPGEEGDVSDLRAATASAARRGHAIVSLRRSGEGAGEVVAFVVACPLAGIAGEARAAVALQVTSRPVSEQRTVLASLRAGCAGLDLQLRCEHLATSTMLAATAGLASQALAHGPFEADLSKTLSRLAELLACDRASLGLVDGTRVRVRAFSHERALARHAPIVRDLEAAMGEALDQARTVAYPEVPSVADRIALAHSALVRRHGAGAAASVPLLVEGRICGVLTVEAASSSIGEALLPRVEAAAAVLGPIVEARRARERSLRRRIGDVMAGAMTRFVGRGKVRMATASLATLAIAAGLGLGTINYRIAADARLEGSVLRAVVAPHSGYLSSAEHRAGDVVATGEILAELDDRTLKLERRERLGEREKLQKEHRSALAAHDRARILVIDAELRQVAATIALLDGQVARSALVAPVDGVVVSGDHSQALGSPVERGDVLFEVAPLDEYRVAIEVDEREIDEIEVGQRGHLALAAMPAEPLPIVVERLTPIASTREGSNRFRVEARLEEATGGLRPGMVGVVRIQAGERPILWVVTHRLVDWLRLALWGWVP